MPDPHRFTLPDKGGKSHAYETTIHDAVEGVRVLAAFIQYGIGGAFGRLDLSRLLPLGDLVRDVLAHTTRDGLDLRADGAFNDAYRGNYGELIAAAVEVVKVNDFLPLPTGIESGVKRLLAAVIAKAIPASPASPDAAPPSASSG